MPQQVTSRQFRNHQGKYAGNNAQYGSSDGSASRCCRKSLQRFEERRNGNSAGRKIAQLYDLLLFFLGELYFYSPPVCFDFHGSHLLGKAISKTFRGSAPWAIWRSPLASKTSSPVARRSFAQSISFPTA